MNRNLWPYNPKSTTPDEQIVWSAVPPPIEITPHLLSQIDDDSLKRLFETKHAPQYNSLTLGMVQMIKDKVAGSVGTMTREPLTAIRVETIGARMLQIESARAGIPVEGIIQQLLDVVNEGVFNGVPVSNKDRIDVAKFLVNKILPDARGVDTEEKARNLDKKRKKAEDYSPDELKKMTKEELLGIIG